MPVDLTTADEMLKIDYRDGLSVDINMRVPVFSMFEREGEEQAVEADTHRIAIQIAPSQNARTYGTRSPREFARTDGEPVWKKVDTTYVVGYNPIRVSADIAYRAANGNAAMINTLKETLRDLRAAEQCQKERGVCTGYGHDLLFEISSVPGAAPWTYGITDYAGLPGEQMGFVLQALNLLNMYVNVASPTTSGSPLAYRTLRNGGTAAKITSWVRTPVGSETVTFDRQIVGAVVGDVVYRSREDALGVQATIDGLMGLPGLIDNYTLVDPFQTIAASSDAARSFRSEIFDAAASALNEDLLMQAQTAASVLLGGTPEDGSAVRHVMVGNTITVNAFAQSLTAILNTAGAEADRGRRTMYPVTREGFKPQYGYARKFLTYNGVPFVDGQLALRNSLFTINLDDVKIIHNGPPEGDFLSPMGGGPHVLRVPGTPISEYVWVWMMQLVAERRNGSNRIKNLATPQYM